MDDNMPRGRRGSRARDIERKRARRCKEIRQPELRELSKTCSCGARIFGAYDSSGSLHLYELDSVGRLALEMSKRYIGISNRPVRTAWELYARAAMAADENRCKQHAHTAESSRTHACTRNA